MTILPYTTDNVALIQEFIDETRNRISDGVKLEIKSAAFIQSWSQKNHSKISFSTKAALSWNLETSQQSAVKMRHADVYVFCLLNRTSEQDIDPLNMNHWEFYVMSTKELDNYSRSQHSITLKSLQSLTTLVSYNQLNDAIKEKYKLNF